MKSSDTEVTEKYSLRGQVFHKLREFILTGNYQEGELLQEIKISKEFGVSRTPVREALKQLELEGLVNMIPNKGAKVSSISKEDIGDIYDIRYLIEGLAAKRAAQIITEQQLNDMEDLIQLAEFYSLKNNLDGIVSVDSEFHKILYNSCGSKYLHHILTDFHQYSQMARIKSLSNSERAENSLEEHKSIFNALKERDSKKAEELAKKHVENAKKNLQL